MATNDILGNSLSSLDVQDCQELHRDVSTDKDYRRCMRKDGYSRSPTPP